MTRFLCLAGEPALSSHRGRRLMTTMADSGVDRIEGRWFYLIEACGALSEESAARLRELLDARHDPALLRPASTAGRLDVYVTPRAGTLSPWGSKATDIAHNCGMADVQRIERGIHYRVSMDRSVEGRAVIEAKLHDRMTESVFASLPDPAGFFAVPRGEPMQHLPMGAQGKAALVTANRELGLALSDDEIDYLVDAYTQIGRDPTDVELMMFAQANSEHCRHKIFNAQFVMDGREQSRSLFRMIRDTHDAHPRGTVVAYSDNAAILEGGVQQQWQPLQREGGNGRYEWHAREVHRLLKVETHNHPTAIAPHAGAATGSGGEIRDEGATGLGGTPRYGLTGFTVSHLRIPEDAQPWEQAGPPPPDSIASPLSIMIDGPLGGAAFNNEFGRPNLCGYFRTFEARAAHGQGAKRGQSSPGAEEPPGLARSWGYHKPIMIAGGVGSVDAIHSEKQPLPAGTLLIQLGGPGMRIGLGGGAASSMGVGANNAELDFASVQRANAEMERRAQEVIDRCIAFGERNPILSIHDVGAGGLSNALPEIAEGAGRGARISLGDIPVAEAAMTPAEIWCNESQERYVLAIAPDSLELFRYLCARERCPFAVVGTLTDEPLLQVRDDSVEGAPLDAPTAVSNSASTAAQASMPVDMPMDVLFGKAPRMRREGRWPRPMAFIGTDNDTDTAGIDLDEVVRRVLRFPAVGSKEFLITIGDRTVGGLSSRDQMVGPWQVPVADAAVGLLDHVGHAGDAMAMGERTPTAMLDAAAASRLAISEALTNLLSACPTSIGDVKLSANWMASCGSPERDGELYAAVKAASDLCIALGTSIPVGKDSLSMRTRWQQTGTEQTETEQTGTKALTHADLLVESPVSLIVTATAPVRDVRDALTPLLQLDRPSVLIFVDLSGEVGAQRLGASVFEQVMDLHGDATADLRDAGLLKQAFSAMRALRDADLVTAYHDRSDGGLFVTACEMAFASHCGVSLTLDMLTFDEANSDWGDYKIRRDQVKDQRDAQAMRALFNEEPGFVIQVDRERRDEALAMLRTHGLSQHTQVIGMPNAQDTLELLQDGRPLWTKPRTELQRLWSETSHRVARLRDDPQTVDEGRDAQAGVLPAGLAGQARATLAAGQPQLRVQVDFDWAQAASDRVLNAARGSRPRVAVLREQGVNSHREMAAAFDFAGFESVDVHMTDLIDGRHRLRDFQALVACGGFSYGDVLGGGTGWARSVLFNARLAEDFTNFFHREDTLTLGVCNGCQMLSQLKVLIPGAAEWPRFLGNQSGQYEARLSSVEIMKSSSKWFDGMHGAVLPIVVAHGEGRVDFAANQVVDPAKALPVMRFVDANGTATERYPANPNGSAGGVTGYTSSDGRATILMPHPERGFRFAQWSWVPEEWRKKRLDHSPWMRIWQNARRRYG